MVSFLNTARAFSSSRSEKEARRGRGRELVLSRKVTPRSGRVLQCGNLADQ